MVRLLDTANVAAGEREEALVTTMLDTSGATQVTLENDSERVVGTVDVWSLGAAGIFRTESTGVSLIRRARTARTASDEIIALGVQELGVGRHGVGSVTRVVPPGEIVVVDVTRPFDFAWSGFGASRSLLIPRTELALPMDTVRRGGARLASSPLYRLVSRHVAEVARHADELSNGTSAASIGSASIELARALLSTAGDSGAPTRDVVEQTLMTQVRAFVRLHLSDPDLGPARISSALAVSPRQVYRACAGAGISLEQWIIDARLDAVKHDLGRRSSRHQTIGAIARRWGFRDPTHFTRRFRERYGVLPSTWREAALREEDPAAVRVAAMPRGSSRL